MDKTLLYVAIALFGCSIISWFTSMYLEKKLKYTLSIIMLWIQLLCMIFAIASLFIYKNF